MILVNGFWASLRRCAVLPPISTSGSKFVRCRRTSQESPRGFRIFLILRSCRDLSATPFNKMRAHRSLQKKGTQLAEQHTSEQHIGQSATVKWTPVTQTTSGRILSVPGHSRRM